MFDGVVHATKDLVKWTHAMIVRAAAYEQAQRVSGGDQRCALLRRLITMERLDSPDPHRSELGDEVCDPGACRMRYDCDASNRFDEFNGLAKRAPNTRDVEGRSFVEIRQEGFVEISRDACGDEFSTDVDTTRNALGTREYRLSRDGESGVRQARDHPSDPCHPLVAQGLERIEKFRILEVDPITQDVDLTITVHRRELDSGDEPKTEVVCRPGCASNAVDRVVVGQGDGFETRPGCERHDVFRRMDAVGCMAVYMEIDPQ